MIIDLVNYAFFKWLNIGLRLILRYTFPGRFIPKTVKMGPNTSLLGTQQKGSWIGGACWVTGPSELYMGYDAWAALPV